MGHKTEGQPDLLALIEQARTVTRELRAAIKDSKEERKAWLKMAEEAGQETMEQYRDAAQAMINTAVQLGLADLGDQLQAAMRRHSKTIREAFDDLAARYLAAPKGPLTLDDMMNLDRIMSLLSEAAEDPEMLPGPVQAGWKEALEAAENPKAALFFRRET